LPLSNDLLKLCPSEQSLAASSSGTKQATLVASSWVAVLMGAMAGCASWDAKLPQS